MSDPATKDDLEQVKRELLVRIDRLDTKQESQSEGLRQQNSAEHGAMQSVLLSVREMLVWIKNQWVRFSRNDSPPVPPKHD